jgi:hypothetical protein
MQQWQVKLASDTQQLLRTLSKPFLKQWLCTSS